ncbi:MAG: PKD domain-containing protein [Candidatus Margulisbacteria bacterium]|nr:PKD domain-containing protein [Candidatus Margulisiibacteriota bacterium]
MNKIIHKLIYFAFLIGVLALYGCGDVTTTISGLSASPSTVVAGKTASITCAVSAGTDTTSNVTYTYSWSATGGSFATSFGNPVTWTAPTTAGIYVITVTVTRSDGNVSSASINMTVTSATQESSLAPVINSLTAEASKVTPGNQTTLYCSASNQSVSSTETSTLTYTWVAYSGVLESNTGKSVIWTAPSTAGTYTVEVTVSNGTYATVGTLNLIVTGESSSSVIKITNMYYSPATIYGGDVATLTCEATDSVGSDLTYSWSATGGTIASKYGKTVTWTSPTTEGTYIAVVDITDTVGNSNQGTMNLVVNKKIDPPTINSTSANPTSISLGSTSQITCSATDPNSPTRTLTYTWTVSSGTLNPAESSSQNYTTFTPTATGTYTVNVKVTNGGSSYATGQATVTVN